MVLAVVVLIRAAYIQLLGNSRLETMARRQFQTHTLVRPRRGLILDRNNEPLAANVETSSLAANPGKIKDKQVICRVLSQIAKIPYKKLRQKFDEDREFIWIKRHLTEAELKKFKKSDLTDLKGNFIDGLWLVKESQRVYPHGRLASHVLGGVNIDSEGLEGVELWMNEHLRGQIVSVSSFKDALGRPTFIDAVAADAVKDGASVKLTLDGPLQFEVEHLLENAVRRTGAKSGSVIVMNTMTGEILALANEPTFRPQDKKEDVSYRRNRAITDGYEPGSTLKALLLAGMLSYGGKLTDEVWGERGSFFVQGHKISEAEAKEQFEWVSLKKMIQVSSNVAAAKVALRLGADRYLKTLLAFGLGKKTGLGFPGEIPGRVPSRKDWSPLTLANIGFGQGVLVTPIQMLRAYSVFLNGGWLVRPTLFFKDEKERGGQLKTQVISSRVSREVAEALTTVTEEGGTGIKASLAGFQVAGKTGTAQLVDPISKHYSKDKYIASFIGFPLGVSPKFIIFSSLVEPKGVYYASETAAPLFKEVLESVVRRYSLPMRANPRRLLAVEANRDSLKISQSMRLSQDDVKIERASNNSLSDESKWIMPSLKGLTPRETIRALKGYPFQLEIYGKGIVSSQTPGAGIVIAEDSKIRLRLTEPK